MTRRTRVGVGVALVIAAVGILARPLLHPDAPRSDPAPAAVTVLAPDLQRIDTIATAAGINVLACAPAPTGHASRRARPGWCGRYTVTRRQTVCATVDLCTVELLGDLTARTATTPVALTVTVRRRDGDWQATAVTS